MIAMQLGDYLDALADALPDEHPALIHEDRLVTWGQFASRTNNLARALRARGLVPGEKIALYMHNGPEYLEGLAASFKSSLTHVNVNYRYLKHELAYLFENSETAVIIYERGLAPRLEDLKGELRGVKLFVEIGGGTPILEGAVPYEDLVNEGDGSVFKEGRSPDDQFFLYTGGTTGMPKAVMWDHYSLRLGQLAAAEAGLGPPQDLAGMKRWFEDNPPRVIHMPVCPQMHGTGLASSNATIMGGGTVVTADNSGPLDAHVLWQAIDKNRVTHISLVGDIFARPMLEALNDKPDHYRINQVEEIDSAGVMWSREVKQGLIDHMQGVALKDNLSSSEAPGMGASVTTKDQEFMTAKFELNETTRVFDEDDNEVVPGSGVHGQLAVGGVIPMGYYKDEVKTANTFRIVQGERYVIPGDWAMVEADGSLTLLGRGSVCINTGGEKVFPEEVEEAIKRLEGVVDAVVVGVPDPKWGEAITAIVQGDLNDAEAVITHVKGELANYKVPKNIIFKQDLGRAPNGKADYKGLTAFALKHLNLS